MRTDRKVTVGGKVFTVPPRIQRIDIGPTKAPILFEGRVIGHRMKGGTHGWQVRYQGTMLFSDGGDPGNAFRLAVSELQARYAITPPPDPTGLRWEPLSHKQNDLPAGISGPIQRRRKGRGVYADFQVTLPQRDGTVVHTSVYIGTERTFGGRYDMALAKAIKLREDALARVLKGTRKKLRTKPGRSAPAE